MAITASRSSSEIWFEFRFDVYDPAKNAATPTTIINPIINPLNVDFLQIPYPYYFDLTQNHQNHFDLTQNHQNHFDLTQNHQNSFELVPKPSILNRIGKSNNSNSSLRNFKANDGI